MIKYLSKILLSLLILLLFIINCEEFDKEKYSIDDDDAKAAEILINKDTMIVANDSLIVTIESTIIDTMNNDTTYIYDSTEVKIFPGKSIRKFKLVESNPVLPERVQEITQNLLEDINILSVTNDHYLVRFKENCDTILIIELSNLLRNQ